MKRSSSSEDGEPANSDNVYSNLQNFLDELEEEDSGEELGQQGGEKKRRLKAEQVRALEKSFEVENKLKPERKAELAQELGLQPRQVAVWFQNRRARWKTKHLEKDYALLKASYESLKLKHASLLQEKDTILAELNQLKSSRSEEKQRGFTSSIMEETENPIAETEKKNCVLLSKAKLQKEDSCCSEVIEAGCGLDQMMMTLMSSSTSSSDIGFFDSAQEEFYRHGLAMEAGDDYISSAEESCNFFSDEQPPTFSWYSCDQWN